MSADDKTIAELVAEARSMTAPPLPVDGDFIDAVDFVSLVSRLADRLESVDAPTGQEGGTR